MFKAKSTQSRDDPPRIIHKGKRLYWRRWFSELKSPVLQLGRFRQRPHSKEIRSRAAVLNLPNAATLQNQFLMLWWPSIIKLVLLLLHNYNFSNVMHDDANISHVTSVKGSFDPQVENG